jgi:hypothetical protein
LSGEVEPELTPKPTSEPEEPTQDPGVDARATPGADPSRRRGPRRGRDGRPAVGREGFPHAVYDAMTLLGVRGWLSSPRRVLPVVLPVLVLVVVALLMHNPAGYLDLEVYRMWVQAWLAGGDLYGSVPPAAAGVRLPFVYPPFAAMVLAPLVLLPWTASWITMFALSLTSLATTLYILARRVWPAGELAAAFAMASAALPLALLLEPVQGSMKFGQINVVLMALVALDCLVEKPRWPRGLLVGLAAAIKLTPAAFVLFFLGRRDTPAAAVAAVTALAATAWASSSIRLGRRGTGSGARPRQSAVASTSTITRCRRFLPAP